MAFALLGINHKTANVAQREQFAFNLETLDAVLYSLTSHPLITGAVILSTCNRTEIYFSFEQENECSDLELIVRNWLYEYHHFEEQNLNSLFYFLPEKKTIQHLMEVACGIDSMILGEPQILGQVRQAYHLAQEKNCLSSELNKLFQTVFHVAKRVRTETEIGSHSASISYSVYQLIQKTFFSQNDSTTELSANADEPFKLSVMFVGAGEMNALIGRYLSIFSFEKVLIANRTQKNAQAMAEPLNAEVISLSAIADRIKEVDIVISCTASPLPIIGKGMVERSIAYRQKKGFTNPMLLIDLAVPHDIEREINELPDVMLKTIDDLQQVVDSHLAIRQKAAMTAKNLIEEEVNLFIEKLQESRIAQFIQFYRESANQIKTQLVNETLCMMQNKTDHEAILVRFAHKLTQKLLHLPTSALKQIARQEQSEILKLLTQLNHKKIKQKK